MTAGVYNFTVCQGSYHTKDLLFKDDLGMAIDLTGFTFASQARLTFANDVAFIMTLTVANQGTDKGHVTLVITSEATSALEITDNTDYVYDIEQTNGGIITRVLQGTITVTPEVTR